MPAETVTLHAELRLGVDRVVLAHVVPMMTDVPVAMVRVDLVVVDPVALAPHAPVTIVLRVVISTPTAALVALLTTAKSAAQPAPLVMTVAPAQVSLIAKTADQLVRLVMTAVRLVRTPTVMTVGGVQLLGTAMDVVQLETTDAVALRLAIVMTVGDASHLVVGTNAVRPVPTPVAMGVLVPIVALVVTTTTVAQSLDRPAAKSQMTAAVRTTVRAVILMTVLAVRAKVDVLPLTATIAVGHRVLVDATLVAALAPRTESVSNDPLRPRSRSVSTLSGLLSLEVGVA